MNPATRQQMAPAFATAGPGEVDEACALAANAFDAYRGTTPEQRAVFLERIASGIDALGEELIERAAAESGLPQGRLQGERARTTGQLRMFARLLRTAHWQQLAVDTPQPQRQPLPRSDLRLQQIPLGPVAVFGASNFPLAFSVAGGDTASALAAGCPVVVKAHPSHPGTSELVGRAVREAVQACQLPNGVFSMVGGEGHEVGACLVSHPAIQAVGFTGSRSGGLALMRVAQERPQPIPVYAEMSSVNPVFILPAALAAHGERIAQGFVDSLVLGSGQFCTNPGLVIGVGGAEWDKFVGSVANAIAKKPAATMLTEGIHRAYASGTARLARRAEVLVVATGQAASNDSCAAQAVLHQASATQFLSDPVLEEEVFGPSSLLIHCNDLTQMQTVAEHLSGQLTATLWIEDGDYADARNLMRVLERKAGRILANGFPTGVEVGYAMVHGGPYPATSDSRSTSVGASAISRFLRPVCYQDIPDGLLPPVLTREGLASCWRIVDGDMVGPSTNV